MFIIILHTFSLIFIQGDLDSQSSNGIFLWLSHIFVSFDVWHDALSRSKRNLALPI